MINSIRKTTASLGSSLKGLFNLISSGPSLASSTLSGKSAHDAQTVAFAGGSGRIPALAAATLFVLLHAGFANASTIYYVDGKSGSDSNNGLTQATAFKTIAMVNTITPLLQPGDQVLLHAGERFTDDFIHCDNLVKAAATTTLITNPAVCSGTASAPIVFGKYSSGADPIIDAADQLTGLVWRSLGNGVYSTPLAVAPQKLYIDKLTEAPQLIPVPNFVGDYDSHGATTYQPWDAVLDASTGLYQMNGGNTPQKATIGALGLGGVWGSPYATTSTGSGQTSQVFSPTNTGLENVEAIGGGSVYFSLYGGTGYPASFTFSSTGGGSVGGVACEVNGSVTSVSGVPANVTYSVNRGCSSIPAIKASAATGTGLKFFGRVDSGSFYYASASQNGALANELYVHLPDGSDPSHHTFFATHRSYGILLRGVNNVAVTHIQFAHQLKSGVMSFPYASSTTPGMYWTNENITISHATCWNTGDTVGDTLAWAYSASRTANLEACIVLRASGDQDPHLVRGNSISDSWSGLIDMYYGRGDSSHANFILSGIDGTRTVNGVTSNYPVIQYSYGRSHNSACIRYGQVGLTRDALYLNKGGIVSNNECTGNANGNIFFGATAGGQVTHNYVHDSLGEGI